MWICASTPHTPLLLFVVYHLALTHPTSVMEHGSLLVEKVRLVVVDGVNTEQTESSVIFWTEGRARNATGCQRGHCRNNGLRICPATSPWYGILDAN
jgi:hypothetical protein